jgi:hypothetical protein
MLDCMMAYESNFRTQMYLLDAKAPLPCPEPIWDAAVLDKAQIPILNDGSSYNQIIFLDTKTHFFV